ncbi:MAG: hypothetical protein U1E46_17440 [Hyphomicrobiales bacterium]
MKRFLYILPLLIAAPAAFAATSGLKVVNNSGLPIDELYVSKPGAAKFGQNLMDGMAEGSLDNGKSATVKQVADGTWDVRISAPDEGVLCVIPKAHVKGGKLELTPDLGKACK